MDSTDILKSALKNERELFLNNLSSFTILDIGTIVEVKNGRALVHGSSFIGGQQTIYDDAEIIYPGNEGGAYVAESAGTPCLIFIPLSCMPSISNRNVQLRAASYDTDGVKVMPIGNAASALVKTWFNSGGIFSILSKIYSLAFDENSINLERRDSTASLSMDCRGGLHLIKQGEDSTHYIDDVDSSKTETWISKEKDVQWVDTLNSDGSRTFVQSDPNAEEGDDPLCSLTIAADGTVTLTGKATEQLNVIGDTVVTVDGDAKINADNIELNGNDKRLVTYAELKEAMDKLWIAMITTPIAGNGSTQPSWTGISSIDISASETRTIKTGG